MNLIDSLMEEYKYLEKIIAEASERLAKAPQGKLIKKNERGATRFYSSISGKIVYLSRSKNFDLIQKLAQKDYDRRIIKRARERLAAILAFGTKIRKLSLLDINSKALACRIEIPCVYEDFGETGCKSVSDASTEENRQISIDTDFARNLLTACEAFLSAKECNPR